MNILPSYFTSSLVFKELATRCQEIKSDQAQGNYKKIIHPFPKLQKQYKLIICNTQIILKLNMQMLTHYNTYKLWKKSCLQHTISPVSVISSQRLLELGCGRWKQVRCENSSRNQQWTARFGWMGGLGSEDLLQCARRDFVPGDSTTPLQIRVQARRVPGRNGNAFSKAV